MPTTTTYKTSDWKVWTYKPVADKFILDFSQLDDAATPLSSTNGTVTQTDLDITGITINEGTAVDGSIFTAPTAATALVTAQITNFTKTTVNNYIKGTAIWITHTNPNLNGNAWNNLGKNTPYFMGVIDDFQVNVNPGEDFAQIAISAVSPTQAQLNTPMSLDTGPTSYRAEKLKAAADAAGYWLESSTWDGFYFYSRGNVIKTYGEWLSGISDSLSTVQVDYCWFSSQGGTSGSPNIEFKQGFWADKRTYSPATMTSDIIMDVEFGWSNANAPIAISLTNEGDSNIVYQKGNGDPMGGGIYQASIDIFSLDSMVTVATNLLNFRPKYAPISVTTLVATDNQTMTWGDFGLAYGFYHPLNLNFFPTYSIYLDLPDYGFDNERVIITGRSMEITRDNWTATYNLWKGQYN